MTLEQTEKTAAIGKQLTSQQNGAVEALKEQVAALTEQVAALATGKQTPASHLVSCVSAATNLGMCSVIALIDLDIATYVGELDISRASAGRETTTGRLEWAGGAPNDSKPFVFAML